MPEARKRVAVLISGRGSNLAALIAASKAADYPAAITLVVSNRADAGGLQHASVHGIPAVVVDDRDYSTKAEFEVRIGALLRDARVDLICLAGFMRILSPAFVGAWPNCILNIHPSLLPLFPGLDTHQRALAAGVKEHGATVHFVSAEVDCGPIVAQAALPIMEGDTPDTLAARVLEIEHELYPRALGLVASGGARIADGRLAIDVERGRFERARR